MPLSEHEQRMLEQIESALYAEDPKFASSVKRRRLGRSSGRRRLQAVAIFVVGLVLLVGGLIVEVRVGGFPIISLIGFLVMFGAGLLALWGGGSRSAGADREHGNGAKESRGSAPKRKFSERMEERFNRRFEQE
ncbi:DUF3040 domain-containing protein [Gordonia hankookensis]|uniref:DUF3040 domain-containing protein n=1 Tax=Gordonia hankookensis TaxID=589403 RepID=A0ABR7W5K1_9ACTN|nr:DUF3040 domain-containing protein [Gordonia hankookensis]MBD1318110.1 DUF3040 domain-containing protein [Gordonia hankookensis]NDZ95466.1 DUF3040 domain-containing protein [Streptomyces sp. SID11726]NEB25704.1 DUF3040 domain-containing protein [Streptomyces sp. SID6673]